MNEGGKSFPPGGRAYLCPLDKADDLPDLTFGFNRITKFSAAELEMLFNPTPSPADLEVFEQFTWLVVGAEEFEPEFGQRPLGKAMK